MNRRIFHSLCVFCGSSEGNNPLYKQTTIELADWMAVHNIGLVYGGAKVGLMGLLADRLLRKQGQVTGVIPELLMLKEIAHTGLTKLNVVRSMHERKQKMYELADGFIALPGGLGTMDEIFEVITWGQLGLHQKPCGFLNVGGYFNELLRFFDKAVEAGFIKPEHRHGILFDVTVAGLYTQMQQYRPLLVPKWIQTPEQA